MKFIKMLQEAASTDLPELKKLMLKDKRIPAAFFKADSKLSDIDNPEVFVATVKFWLLNNTNVINFVKSRNNIKLLDYPTLLSNRKILAKDITETDYQNLKSFTSELFKEFGSVARGSLSTEARKDLEEFINGNRGHHSLRKWVMDEISSVPSLRPTTKTLLYRGLLFSKSSLQERTTYDGTLEKGNGLKFLEAVREGTKIVDLEWDRASSWTTKKAIAEQFAKYGPATSSNAATFQWLGRMKDKKAIDGELGFVISTYAEPEDVIIDISKFNGRAAHGDEGEMILHPGTYTCRISKKFTVEGEVEVSTDSGDDAEGEAVIDKVIKAFDKCPPLPKIAAEVENVRAYDGGGTLKDIQVFKKLVSTSNTDAIAKYYDAMLELYNSTLQSIDMSVLKADKFVKNSELRRKIKVLSYILDIFNAPAKHAKFNGSLDKRHKLTSAEFRTTLTPSDVRDIEYALIRSNHFSTKETSKSFEDIAWALSVEMPKVGLYRLSAAKQAPVIEATLKAFCKEVGVAQPADTAEAAKIMTTFLRKAYRNLKISQDILSLYKKFESLKGSQDATD